MRQGSVAGRVDAGRHGSWSRMDVSYYTKQQLTRCGRLCAIRFLPIGSIPLCPCLMRAGMPDSDAFLFRACDHDILGQLLNCRSFNCRSFNCRSCKRLKMRDFKFSQLPLDRAPRSQIAGRRIARWPWRRVLQQKTTLEIAKTSSIGPGLSTFPVHRNCRQTRVSSAPVRTRDALARALPPRIDTCFAGPKRIGCNRALRCLKVL